MGPGRWRRTTNGNGNRYGNGAERDRTRRVRNATPFPKSSANHLRLGLDKLLFNYLVSPRHASASVSTASSLFPKPGKCKFFNCWIDYGSRDLRSQATHASCRGKSSGFPQKLVGGVALIHGTYMCPLDKHRQARIQPYSNGIHSFLGAWFINASQWG